MILTSPSPPHRHVGLIKAFGVFGTPRPPALSYRIAPFANAGPTLTSVAALDGAVEDGSFTITYDAIAAAANESDADGDTLSFRVESVTGTLTKDNQEVTPGETLVSAGETLVWHPPADANGTLPAFAIKAWDGRATSYLPVRVNVQPVNDAPVALAAARRP